MIKPDDKFCVRCGVGEREAKSLGELGRCSVYGVSYGRHSYQQLSYKPKTLAWFVKRIGKTIYRDDDGCPCLGCKEIVENGFVVTDRNHANYLEAVDNDFAADGVFLNYRDKK